MVEKTEPRSGREPRRGAVLVRSCSPRRGLVVVVVYLFFDGASDNMFLMKR